MGRIYRLPRKGIYFIQKIRRHRGHGIHSPFVFDLVNNVIEEKTPYYAYEYIKEYLLSCRNVPCKIDKLHKLSFKLINCFGAKQILELGAGNGINTLFMTAVSSSVKCQAVETDENKYNLAHELYSSGWDREIVLKKSYSGLSAFMPDCVYINLNNFGELTQAHIDEINNVMHPGSFIIVEGIRTNRKNKLLWNKIKDMDGRTVALDLFNIGIIFFNPKLYRWEYKISF